MTTAIIQNMIVKNNTLGLFQKEIDTNFNNNFTNIRQINDISKSSNYSVTGNHIDWTTHFYGITAFPYIVVVLDDNFDNTLHGFSSFSVSSSLSGYIVLDDIYLLNNTAIIETANIFETSSSITSSITSTFNPNISFIDYRHGVIILDSSIESITNLICSTNIRVKRNVWTCVLKANEFNITTNPTAYDNLTGTISAYSNPYITTVGLYDNNDNLLVIGKFTSPIKKSTKVDMVLKIQVDM
jgi:hypothetical protein